jgi:peptidoglycan/LPS O-acetylase OafA/YrhL
MLDWLRFFAVGRGMPLSLYLAFQLAALLCLRGRFRVAASAPLLLAILIGANMAWAYPHGNNVWRMIMLTVAPGAVLAIVLVWGAEVAYCRRRTSALCLAALGVWAVWAAASGQHAYLGLWRSGWAIAWTITTVLALLGFGLVASQLRR